MSRNSEVIWIKPEEQLPEDDQPVLYIMKYSGNVFSGAFARDDGYVFYGRAGFLNFHDVSYWAEMPKVPDDAKQD